MCGVCSSVHPGWCMRWCYRRVGIIITVFMYGLLIDVKMIILFRLLRATVVVVNDGSTSTFYPNIMSEELTYNGKFTGTKCLPSFYPKGVGYHPLADERMIPCQLENQKESHLGNQSDILRGHFDEKKK